MSKLTDIQVMQFIDELSLEDLREIVKDIYVMPSDTPQHCAESGVTSKIRILEYLAQDYIHLAYWAKQIGEVPPPDMESNDE